MQHSLHEAGKGKGSRERLKNELGAQGPTLRGPFGVKTAAMSYKAMAMSSVQVVHSGMPVNRKAMMTPVMTM